VLRRFEKLAGHEATADAQVINCRRQTFHPVHRSDSHQRTTSEDENIRTH